MFSKLNDYIESMKAGNKKIYAIRSHSDGHPVFMSSSKAFEFKHLMAVGSDINGDTFYYDAAGDQSSNDFGFELVIKDNQKIIVTLDNRTGYYGSFKSYDPEAEEPEDMFETEVPLDKLTVYLKYSKKSCILFYSKDAEQISSIKYDNTNGDALEPMIQLYLDGLKMIDIRDERGESNG